MNILNQLPAMTTTLHIKKKWSVYSDINLRFLDMNNCELLVNTKKYYGFCKKKLS